MSNLYKLIAYIGISSIISGCGFHLRGYDGEYKLPYDKIYVICNNISVCDEFKQTVTREHLSTIVKTQESSAVIISFSDQLANKTADSYSSIGRISNFNLSYSVDVTLLKATTMEVIKSFNAKSNMSMRYNDGLILSMDQQEASNWEELHRKVSNQIITRIVHLNKNHDN